MENYWHQPNPNFFDQFVQNYKAINVNPTSFFQAHNLDTHLSTLNFSMILSIITRILEHPTLIMTSTSKVYHDFSKNNSFLSCRSLKRSHDPQAKTTQTSPKTKKKKEPPSFPKDSSPFMKHHPQRKNQKHPSPQTQNETQRVHGPSIGGQRRPI